MLFHASPHSVVHVQVSGSMSFSIFFMSLDVMLLFLLVDDDELSESMSSTFVECSIALLVSWQ